MQGKESTSGWTRDDKCWAEHRKLARRPSRVPVKLLQPHLVCTHMHSHDRDPTSFPTRLKVLTPTLTDDCETRSHACRGMQTRNQIDNKPEILHKQPHLPAAAAADGAASRRGRSWVWESDPHELALSGSASAE